MLFFAQFGPHADKPEVFRQNLEPHRAYLRDNKARILLSASALVDPESPATSHIWLIEADSRDEAEGICHGDPFWQAGLRTTFELFHVKKALPDVTATI